MGSGRTRVQVILGPLSQLPYRVHPSAQHQDIQDPMLLKHSGNSWTVGKEGKLPSRPGPVRLPVGQTTPSRGGWEVEAVRPWLISLGNGTLSKTRGHLCCGSSAMTEQPQRASPPSRPCSASVPVSGLLVPGTPQKWTSAWSTWLPSCGDTKSYKLH